jgi:hypothetical protein
MLLELDPADVRSTTGTADVASESEVLAGTT